MKQNILKAAILAAGFCCTVGCSDNDSDLTIYIPDAGTAVKANFYIEDEPYVQTFNVAVTPETYPQLTEYGLPNDAVVHLQADPGKVDEYNAKNGTEYELLPEAAYDLTEEVLVKAGTPKSEEAVITVHAKGNIEAFKEYQGLVSAARKHYFGGGSGSRSLLSDHLLHLQRFDGCQQHGVARPHRMGSIECFVRRAERGRLGTQRTERSLSGW